MDNTFTGSRMNVANNGCRVVLADIIAFRKQLTLKHEFNEAGGWNHPLNYWLARELGRIRETLAYVTTDQSDAASQKARLERAKQEATDEDRTLLEEFEQGNPITTDNIQMPASAVPGGTLPYELSGSDPRIPQIGEHKNVMLCELCTLLDITFRTVTNLDCQGSGQTIPKQQSAMIHALLNGMFVLLQTKGGEDNRREIADGTDTVQAGGADVIGTEVAGAPAT